MFTFSLWGSGKSGELQSTQYLLLLLNCNLLLQQKVQRGEVLEKRVVLGVHGQARQTSGELVVTMSFLCSFNHQAIVQNLLK